MQTIETEDKPGSLEKFLEVNSWEGGDGLKRFDAVSGKTVRTHTLSKYEEARQSVGGLFEKVKGGVK